MKLHELNAAPEAKTRKRVGRGPGSGLGKTSGRGENGQKSRSGASIPAWFQGGQTPLYRRVPKRGFNNVFSIEYATVNVSDLERFENGTVVNMELLLNEGIVRKPFAGLKVLGNGTLTKKLTVEAKKFTASAKEKVEAVGGKIEVK